ncbi:MULTISPECIES: ATP-binding protein [unclassified Coleofasciculus]|uniref:PAS domain-containing sensor histidine kinase n=1 Tax=unclassified Coleofasciculus TaxID=2692782 RepID=UPI00187EA78D|nr:MULTISPECIES: ATP-binding protein [unclassified Coleofasciculus]MBE9129996.1 PAS domain S-box protein [Coleofasciculus sp. LEGE 07081]MBE9152372.1 PAS domain S-box protein [Coleofasciculus sp. LEGE 07092]
MRCETFQPYPNSMLEMGNPVSELELSKVHSPIGTVLRNSETLYQLILSSISETVFLTDKTGAFTFISPNVEGMFGYNLQEVQEFGTITQLLGNNLFQWQDLDARGELQNIEREITDKVGRQHILLINVKRVSILESTILYTCRDITEQKRTEGALLAQLQQEKNQQLELTLQELQHAQTQLVQHEKMASLGQLVAGIAHEINNPTSFIYGNIYSAKNYVQDLLHLLRLYQHYYPQPISEIAQQQENIEIDFIADDFPKLLGSMEVGADRIRRIVQSLRKFSHLHEKKLKKVDIHEGLENTLLILQHRLQQQSEIQVVKEYGQLPLLECYPAQLNQVFMNLLINAIDALEGGVGNQKDTSVNPTKADEQRRIWISTELVSSPAEEIPNKVVIRIIDNGSGMTEAVKARIFDPFFTTKTVGRGTGLGLSISYRIVVDEHQGQLKCESTVGQGTEFSIELPTTE